MKRFLSILVCLALVLCMAPSAAAATVPVVTYDGGNELKYTDEAGNPISGNGDFGTAFREMLPGVEYTQQFILKNTGKDTVKFYMSMGVIETLHNGRLDGAGYTVILKSTTETLFSADNGQVTGALVGGSGSTLELGDINGAVVSSDGTGLLVSTVEPGKTDTITLSIKSDATMSNAYQDAAGELKFQFFGEKVEPTGVKVIHVPGKNVVEEVKTGDESPIFLVAGVLVIGVIVLLVTGKKKEAQDEK